MSQPALRPTAAAPRRVTFPSQRAIVSLRLSERRALLFLSDVAAINLTLLTVLAWRFHLPFGWQTAAFQPMWFGLLVGLWAICAPLLNAYDLRRASRVGSGAAAGAAVALLVAVIYLSIPYYTPQLPASRLTAASFVLVMVASVAAGRAAYALFLVQPTFRHRVLVVGAGRAGRELVEALRTYTPTEYDAVGFADDDPAKQGEVVAGLPVLGTCRDLLRLAREWGVSEVVVAVARDENLDASLVGALLDGHEQGIQITAMAPLYERLTGRVPLEYAAGNLHVILPVDRDRNRLSLLVKRGVDVLLGLVGGLATLALLPLVALALRLESPGPVFYRQVRAGRGGRPFSLIKFRTMIPDAESTGPRWAEEDDSRVTRIGRILRRLHLDELPQAINLLRGEMSFIGPRPERPEFAASLEKQIPFYRARHAMRPGITGWAQVNFGYGSSTEDALIKLQYDLYYNKYASLYLDLCIFVRTLALVLTLKGR
ncbi:MAG: sugar transferase [Armatimonadetes bacterium CSP1-3]|nr:MAG: sugar transferase [Armatimonadetes bacterium CSP1-3]